MNCYITIKSDSLENPIKIPMGEGSSNSYLTYKEIAEALISNKEAFDLLQKLVKDDYNKDTIKELDLKTLLENPDGLMGNTTVEYLNKLYPDIFPEGVADVKVLLVKKLKLNGQTLYGRCINSNGEEVFVISEKDIKSFASFLKVRREILENPNLYEKESEKDLEIIRLKYKKDSIANLLLDFMEDKSKFREGFVKLTESILPVSVYGYLDLVLRKINKYTPLKKYTNEVVNALNLLSLPIEDGIKFTNFEDLYNILKTYNPEILEKLEIKDSKEFIKKVYSDDFNKDAFEEVIENKPLIYTLFNYIVKKDPAFKYKIVTNPNLSNKKLMNMLKGIYIKYSDKTFSEEFNVGYETIKTLDVVNEDYKGYRIYAYNYEGEKVYLYSRTFLTEDTLIRDRFTSEEEVKKHISEKVLKEKLRTNSFIKFKLRNKIEGIWDNSRYIQKIEKSPLVFNVGSVVYSLDIKVDRDTIFNVADEYNLVLSQTSTLEDVHNLIRKWDIDEDYKNQIIDSLDNAEKAVTYLYKINELLQSDRSNQEQLLEIANEIKSANKIYYYINSHQKNDYSLIPTEPDELLQYVEDKSYPVRTLLTTMKNVLQEKTGVTIELLTASLIALLFPNSESIDPNTSKAFIYKGLIYVNTTIASGEDLLHEYAHIMLGLLKAKSGKQYENLMYKVISMCSEKELDLIKRIYPDLSEMDLYEELFVKKFSEYLLPQRNTNIKEINDIFIEYDGYLKEGVKSIFDLAENESIPSIFSKTLNVLFKKFSTDIANKLNLKNALDFELITESRKKSDWIRKQIKKGELIESCI